MRNSTKEQNQNVKDLPAMVDITRDLIENSSVRLTTCFKAIERLREIISQNSICFLGDDPKIQEISDAAAEMELLIEKGYSLVDEINTPSVTALHETSEFFKTYGLLDKFYEPAKAIHETAKSSKSKIDQ